MAALLTAILLGLQPVSARAWHAVVNDWLDNNRFDRPHSCAAVVVAERRLERFSQPTYTTFVADIHREARRVCVTDDAARVRVGMSDTAVAAVAGKPRLPLSSLACWAYDRRRVCFTHSRVSRIHYVTHG